MILDIFFNLMKSIIEYRNRISVSESDEKNFKYRISVSDEKFHIGPSLVIRMKKEGQINKAILTCSKFFSVIYVLTKIATGQ